MDQGQVILVAKIGDDIVGTVDIALPLTDNLDLAEFTLDILPEHQCRGVGRQLLEAAEHFAREGQGRTMILVDTNHPGASLHQMRVRVARRPDRARAMCRWAAARWHFAQRTGYTLQHIEQFSSCALPLDSKLVAELEAEAQEANNGRYRLHHWTDRCPERWLESVAALENQAGGDAGLVDGSDDSMVFDARTRRVPAEEVTISQGWLMVVTAVEHIATETLVGLTTISVLAQRQDVVFQDDTVVLQAHRGNKLGLLIKVANMERLTEQFPMRG